MQLKDISKELFLEKTRVVLTILALAWGTFTIASMLAIGQGLRMTFAKAVSKTGDNIMLVSAGKTTEIYKGTHANTAIIIYPRDFDAISKLPAVKSITPIYNFQTTLRYGKNSTVGQIQAVAPNYAAINQVVLKKGSRFVSEQDIKTKAPNLVLGAQAAGDLFKHGENPLGKKILLQNKPFRVVGVAKKKAELIVVETPADYLNWIPFSTYKLLANPLAIGSIAITYTDASVLPKLKREIQTIVALNNGANPNDDGLLNLDDVASQQATIQTFFIGMQIFLGVLGALTLLIAGIGIANVMYASIRRSTHDIGVRMALGARTYHILTRYIAEALLVTIIGGAIGMLATIFFVWVVSVIPMKGQLIEVLGRPEPQLSGLVIFVVILVLGSVGFLAGFFPALKASKIAPAEALIYE